MATKKDSPRVYVPPPLFYVATFLIAVFLQKKIPLDHSFFEVPAAKFVGVLFLMAGLFFLLRSLRQFFISKNTVVTILPARSLQTDGIYHITRNPMYIGLLLVYSAITCFIGNWWNFMILPLLILFVQEWIIKPEERYLTRAFGETYTAYRNKVRRWL